MDETRVSLTIGELRQACARLLERAERHHGADFNLMDAGPDYYWNVDLAAAFNLVERPEQHLDCGQVSDDAAEVDAFLRRDDGLVVSWHDLEHVAALLRLLAFMDLPRDR